MPFDHEALRDAERRIRECRTADVEIALADVAGAPLAGSAVELRLVRHEFKLGANAFCLGALADPGLQAAYDERFAALLK